MPKYPRTFHLPSSPGATNDDKRMANLNGFIDRRLVCTEKLDGSNVCLTPTDVFARSHNGPPTHESFNWLKAKFHGELKHILAAEVEGDEEIEVFCEYTYAVHSIEYEFLPSYLWVIGVRVGGDWWLSWNATEKFAEKLGLPTVPVIDFPWATNEGTLGRFIDIMVNTPGKYGTKEGIVLRDADSFNDDEFFYKVGKWVRANHVQTDEHWTNLEMKVQTLWPTPQK